MTAAVSARTSASVGRSTSGSRLRAPLYRTIVARAIVFDFNGTLSDDEPILCEIFSEALRGARQAAVGAGVLRRARRTLRSGDRPHVARPRPPRRRRGGRASASGATAPPSPTDRRYTSTSAPPFAMPRSVCPSRSARARREQRSSRCVEASGLAPLFRGIVSSDDIVEGKPHPEGYLKALAISSTVSTRPTCSSSRTPRPASLPRRRRACTSSRRQGTLDPHRLHAADELIDRDRRRADAPRTRLMLVIAHRGASSASCPRTRSPHSSARSSSAPTSSSSTSTPTRRGDSLSPTTGRRPGGAYPALEEALELMRGRIGGWSSSKTPRRYRRHDVVGRTVRRCSATTTSSCASSGSRSRRCVCSAQRSGRCSTSATASRSEVRAPCLGCGLHG